MVCKVVNYFERHLFCFKKNKLCTVLLYAKILHPIPLCPVFHVGNKKHVTQFNYTAMWHRSINIVIKKNLQYADYKPRIIHSRSIITTNGNADFLFVLFVHTRGRCVLVFISFVNILSVIFDLKLKHTIQGTVQIKCLLVRPEFIF